MAVQLQLAGQQPMLQHAFLMGEVERVQQVHLQPPLLKTTTFSVMASGRGGTATSSITITVGSPPIPIIEAAVNRDTIIKGETITLVIESVNADTVIIQGITLGSSPENTTPTTTELLFTPLNGIFTTWPILETTKFSVIARGPGGSVQKSVLVYVCLLYTSDAADE